MRALAPAQRGQERIRLLRPCQMRSINFIPRSAHSCWLLHQDLWHVQCQHGGGSVPAALPRYHLVPGRRGMAPGLPLVSASEAGTGSSPSSHGGGSSSNSGSTIRSGKPGSNIVVVGMRSSTPSSSSSRTSPGWGEVGSRSTPPGSASGPSPRNVPF